MKYSKLARRYPALFSTVLVSVALSYAFVILRFPQMSLIYKITSIIVGFIPSSIVTAVIAYFLEDAARWLSVNIVQRLYFGPNGEIFPTTTMLLWSTGDSPLSTQYRKIIAQKVKEDFAITLMNANQEKQNLKEARKRICDAVNLIRNNTRGDIILHEYNIAYGFARNYLGSSLISLLALFVISLYVNIDFVLRTLIVFQILIMAFYAATLKSRAISYAKALYSAYTNIRI